MYYIPTQLRTTVLLVCIICLFFSCDLFVPQDLVVVPGKVYLLRNWNYVILTIHVHCKCTVR